MLEINFATAIKAHDLLARGDHLLVAVSGGADSVALLLLLKGMEKVYDLNLSVFHLNHQFRGEAADEDQAFVEALCQRLGIPCHAFSENIEDYARQVGESFETAARKRRYALMDKLRETYGYQKIALAHHLNDQVETFFQRLSRGTGLDGLTGMDWIREGIYIRPLLGSTRLDIEGYLAGVHQSYRTDATNADVRYVRNRIRHELIPYLEKHFNVNAVQRIGQTMELLSQDKAYLDSEALKWKKAHSRHEDSVTYFALDDLNELHGAMARRVIRLVFAEKKGDLMGLEYQHVEEIMELISHKRHSSEKVFQNIFFRVEHACLAVEKGKRKIKTTDYAYVLPSSGELIIREASLRVRIERCQKNDFEGKKQDHQILLSADQLQGPLTIRNRRVGDAIQLKGMEGRKKVKTLFSELHMTDRQRAVSPIITDGDRLVWVYGGFLAAPHYVKPETESMICITFEKL